MGAHRYRLPLALVAGAGAAAVATFVLRPRGADIEPLVVEAQAYFSPAELARAEAFTGPQRVIGLTQLALTGVALAALALRPPGSVRGWIAAAERRPLLGGAALGAGISLGIGLVSLPLGLLAHQRASAVGLSTQPLDEWFLDLGKMGAIGLVEGAAAGAGVVLLIRRFGERWWIGGGLAAIALAVLFTYAAPVVLEPRFNDFEPLPPGDLRESVLGLAERAGVSVGEVYEIDASRRTTGANAYVGGLGSTRRVVLYDTLLDQFPPAEVRSVVAHELAHVEHQDVPRGLIWLALVALPAACVIDLLARRLAAARRSGPAGYSPGPVGRLPSLALAMALVGFAIGIPASALSRSVERSADRRALELTGEPEALIELQRRLAINNVSDPDPPALLHALLGSHPTALERIGAARSAEKQGASAP